MRPRDIKRFAKELWHEIQDDNVLNGAAVLAFFLLLSIFPAAIFLLSLMPYLPIPHLQQATMDLLHQMLPEQSATLFEGTVKQAVAQKNGRVLTFGFLFLLWSASTGIYAVIQQLNITYDAKESRPWWKVKGMSILLMLLFLVIVIVALSLVIFGGVVQSWIAGLIGWSTALRTLFASLRWIILAAFGLLGFSVIYYFGPDTDQRFRLISPGSLVGIILIAAGSIGFRFYISNFGNYGATYGSLAAMIILILWLYLTSIMLLVGSEINALLEQNRRAPNKAMDGRS
jgi:membrane protein